MKKRSIVFIMSLFMICLLTFKVNTKAELAKQYEGVWVAAVTGGEDGLLVNPATHPSEAAAYGITFNSGTNTLTLNNTTIGAVCYGGTRNLTVLVKGTVKVKYIGNDYYFDYPEGDVHDSTALGFWPASFIRTEIFGNNGDVTVKGVDSSSRIVLDEDGCILVNATEERTGYAEDEYNSVSFSDLMITQEISPQSIVYDYVNCNKLTINGCVVEIGDLSAASLLTIKNSDVKCRTMGSYKAVDIQNSEVILDNSKIEGDTYMQSGLRFGTLSLHGERIYGGTTKAEYLLDQNNFTNGTGYVKLGYYDYSYKMTMGKQYLIITSEDLKLPLKKSSSGSTPSSSTGTKTKTPPAKNTKLNSGGIQLTVTKPGSQVAVSGISSKKKTAAVIPDKVKIGGYTYNVTAIKANAFKNNKKLKKVTIGKNVTSIGKNAFAKCKNLKTVLVKTSKLKASKVGAGAFKGINAKAKIKVPKKKLKLYKKMLKKKGVGKKAVFKGF